MMDFATIAERVGATGLAVVGAFHPDEQDGAPDGMATLILLGPDGAAMWDAFQASPEAGDGAANPLDRWSMRVIGALAEMCGVHALFPFGGPPWHPFQKWAVRGEGARSSPVTMQVTPGRGLWASYRGALAFRERIALPAQTVSDPCLECAAPCQTACPVGAFAAGQYDVPACTAHMKSPAGQACHDGCLVRRACPAGAAIALPRDQRAFHMAAFLRANG